MERSRTALALLLAVLGISLTSVGWAHNPPAATADASAVFISELGITVSCAADTGGATSTDDSAPAPAAATDETATDETATNEVATDEVATDEDSALSETASASEAPRPEEAAYAAPTCEDYAAGYGYDGCPAESSAAASSATETASAEAVSSPSIDCTGDLDCLTAGRAGTAFDPNLDGASDGEPGEAEIAAAQRNATMDCLEQGEKLPAVGMDCTPPSDALPCMLPGSSTCDVVWEPEEMPADAIVPSTEAPASTDTVTASDDSTGEGTDAIALETTTQDSTGSLAAVLNATLDGTIEITIPLIRLPLICVGGADDEPAKSVATDQPDTHDAQPICPQGELPTASKALRRFEELGL